MLNTGVEKLDAAARLDACPDAGLDTSCDIPDEKGMRTGLTAPHTAEQVSADPTLVHAAPSDTRSLEAPNPSSLNSGSLDTDPKGASHLRRCIAQGTALPKEALIRFVVAPDGTLTPDILNKLPGRGIWVSASVDAVELAIKRKAFARAAKQAVTIPDGMTQTVVSLLAKRCMDGLSRARRAGQAVTGFEKVSASLKSGRALVYGAALDAAEDGVARLSRLARGIGVAQTRVLTREELASAFGREDAAHIALHPGGIAEVFLQDCKRLAGFRPKAYCNAPGEHEDKGRIVRD